MSLRRPARVLRRIPHCIVVMALGVATVAAVTATVDRPAAAQVDGATDETTDGATDETVRVIVELETGPADPGAAGAARAVDAAPGVVELEEFETSDFAAVEVDADQLDELRARPEVRSVSVDPVATRALDQSVPLVNAPARWGEGHRGGGVMVAVIDDGVDQTHPNLLGKVEAEACFTRGGCLGGSSRRTGPGSGAPCSGCTHGTRVAGIAVGQGGGFDGVAPDATVFSVRVFPFNEGSARFSDITLGLEHVLSRADAFDIAAVNLSFEGDVLFSGTCDTAFPPMTKAIHALLDRGTAVVASSGNSNSSTRMKAPACISGVTSVGSHTKGLAISGSSNASPITSLVAPGVNITAPGSGSNYSVGSGTSFAAPHVSGAFAIWRDRFPGVNSQEMRFLSTAHGRSIRDIRNNRRYPRLFLDDPARVLLAELFAPTVRSVNGSYRPIIGDFDGSTTDDIFWYAPGHVPDYVWRTTDASGFISRSEPVRGNYRVVAFDQNGDGRDDLLFHGPGSAIDSLWFGRTNGTFHKTRLTLSGNHQLLVGNFTGDASEEVLLYTPGHGADRLLRGGSSVTTSPLQISGSYRPLVGDFDGDGFDDVFWYAPGSAPDYTWYGGSSFTSIRRSVNHSYRPFVGDFDGDGRDDIFWYAPGGTPDYVWHGTQSRSFNSRSVSVNGSYRPVAFDADGATGDEIFWYPTSGHPVSYLWRFNGTNHSSTDLRASGGASVFAADFDLLGGTDLLLYRPGPAGDAVWYSIGD